MKMLTLFFAVALIVSCNSKKELTQDEASRIIKQERQYPRLIDYDIYRSDPAFAKRVIDAGLETQGLVTVQRTQKLGDVGKPLIAFTQKASSSLLPTPEKEKSLDIQKVKLADEELVEVKKVDLMEDGRQAVVEYATSYKNVTPFSGMVKGIGNNLVIRKAYFTLYEDGWKLDKK